MANLSPSVLRSRAEDCLRAAKQPKRLVLLHTAIALGSALMVSVLQYLLSQGIAGTGGLSGMGVRAALSTVQSLLSALVTVLLPFWEIGLIRVARGWVKGEPVTLTTALEGFRRWVTVLGASVIVSVLYLVIGIALMYFSVTVFLLTPFSQPLLALLPTDPEKTVMIPELMQQISQEMLPIFVIFAVLFLPSAAFIAICTRFSDYAVMDGSPSLRAVVQSCRITLCRFWQVLKLDLSYWWYYLGILLCLAVSWADAWLPLLGINLPLNGDLAYFLCTLLGALAQGVLLWQCEAKRLTVYSLAYDALNA